MPICAAWLLKHASACLFSRILGSRGVFMSGRCSLTPILRSPGRGFLALDKRPLRRYTTYSGLRGDAAKRALENAQRLEPNSPETLLALGYYQYWVLRDYGAAKTTFVRVSKMLPGSSEVPYALGRVAPTRGTLGSKRCLLRASPRLGPT